jgi:hypothetical protein
MPPLDQWIPVGTPESPSVVSTDVVPQVPEEMNPPPSSATPQVPEEMNPVPKTVTPKEANPPGSSIPPGTSTPVVLIDRAPAPRFVIESIPDITVSRGFTPGTKPNTPIIVTWPGTDIPVGGTFDPKENPQVFAPVIVKVLEEIEIATVTIQEGGIFKTPFTSSPDKEREAIIQQTFWIYSAYVTDSEYEEEDFAENVYDQFESGTGVTVATLPEDKKEQVDAGIADFWNTFQAVGVEAKVLSAGSPSLDINNPDILATVGASRSPACACDSISYQLEIKRGVTVVHSARHVTPKSPEVKIANFKYGDVFEVKITDISANCACDGSPCEFYPAESENSNSPGYIKTDRTKPGKVGITMENDAAGEIGENGNNNCQNANKGWNADGSEYSFRLETRDEKTNNRSVFQRFTIKAYCELEDCRRKLCKKQIQLNLVTAN